MRIMRSVLVVLTLSAMALPAVQAETAESRSIELLTAEVRKLRLALTRSTGATIRANLLLDQIRLEQDRLTRTQDELRGIRASLDEPMARMEEEFYLDELRERATGGASAEDRRAAEQEMERYEKRRTLMERHRESTMVRRNELESAEAQSSARIETLMKRLDELERELSSPPAAD